MKKLLAAFAFTLLALFVGCSDEKTTQPEGGGPQPDATATIGPEGGSLETDGFTLTVPENAFTGDATLSVTMLPDQDPFEEQGISPTFRIDGLPYECHESLELSIEYEGSLAEHNFIAIGEETYIHSLSVLDTTYCFFDAVPAGDRLVCQLIPPDDAFEPFNRPNFHSPSLPSSQYIWGQIVTLEHSYTTDEGHFELLCPNACPEPALIEFGNQFENAYDIIKDQLDFSYEARTVWPVRVAIQKLKAAPGGTTPYGYYSHSWWKNAHGYIAASTAIIDNPQDMPTLSMHEFFHLVQYLYDPRSNSEKCRVISPYAWINEAASVYSETIVAGSESYLPHDWTLHWWAPFSGIQAGVELDGAANHGYGMSAMLKYILQRYGYLRLIHMYGEMDGGEQATEAFLSGSADPSEWLNDFYREYVLGNVFQTDPGYFAKCPAESFVVGAADDTVKTFGHYIGDYGAMRYTVELDYPGVDPDAKMTITTDIDSSY
ncbi:MAG: hypothetical protein GF418_14115, partial [Chitinivibrionales bacterium]|nr:hypothetical protein [Chitinivibrionales bacterium]